MKTKLSRRSFLWLAGGTGASVLFKPGEKAIHELIPYVNAPQYPMPGEWAHLPTTCRECPAGCGLLMSHRDGRATKAEGNPNHIINRGKLCIRGQSSVQGLYDTDRLKNVFKKDEEGNFIETNWESAFRAVKEELSAAGKVLLVSDLQTGSLEGAMENFVRKYNGELLFYEAFNYESMQRANEEMYGERLVPKVDLEGTDLIVSFGVDFLETWLSPVEHARQFSYFHALKDGKIGKMVYIGPVETMTAINSDQFIQINPGKEASVILALIQRLSEKGAFKDETPAGPVELPEITDPGIENEQLDRLAGLIAQANTPVILAGRPEDGTDEGTNTVKAANLLNELLGNRQQIDFSANHALGKTAYKAEVRKAFQSISKDTVVLIHSTNPAFSDVGLAEHLNRAQKVVYLGTMKNETADLADWLLPVHSSLEDWGDYEAQKGTISLMQPAMRPVFETTLSAGDIFLELAGENDETTFKDVVRSNWKKWAADQSEENQDDAFFTEVLRKGFLAVEAEPKNIQPKWEPLHNLPTPLPLDERTFYFHLSPSLFFYDGRLANRNWLQEIPNPVSNIVWQSWLDINTEKAKALAIENGDLLNVTTENITLNVVARHADHLSPEVISMEAGQGHWALGKTADKVGVNAFSLLNPADDRFTVMVSIEKTGKNEPLLALHPTMDQESRELLRHEEAEKLQNATAKKEPIAWPLPDGYLKDRDLYKGHEHKKHRWGMVIDLQSCIGCKACEAACYAENNVPIVGRKNAAEGREMSWLKIVPYKDEKGKIAYLPTPCQHCDSAPCEPVCPVFASVHTEEGLNAQIYNRCIGTRYCSNNCPYKVRRFNWSNIKYEFPENLRLNPEVTVRSRGVMEKCTFCVQRIKNKQHQAKVENREVQDGEIVPACAQTCPTDAIVFGDLMDENSKVRKLMADGRRYQLLHELNTKPAVVYLKKIDQKT